MADGGPAPGTAARLDSAADEVGRDHQGVGRARSPGFGRVAVLVGIGLVLAVALVLGGYRLGVAAERPGAAGFTELDEGLAVALGVTAADVRGDREYRQYEGSGCRTGVCRQVTIGPVSGPGHAMQLRLYRAGWVLHGHDEPECVSDGPDITGWVCSYDLGDVTVSIQVESPETPDQLHVWASTP